MARNAVERVSDVFKSIGQPKVTYVTREAGRLEAILKNALLTAGQLCLITGPSKTGKTTLYKKVLETLGKDPLVVRCNSGMTATDLWSEALESIDFERIKEVARSKGAELSVGIRASGQLKWGWLASLKGEGSLDVSGAVSEEKIRERILAKPSPHQLIPALKRTNIVLVVEDYHYLKQEVQQVVFQQWKAFVDSEVSVLVLGTTHHAIDIISSNKDLLARKSHIEVSGWNESDLKKIIRQGFGYLEVDIPESVEQLIARESVGLPILTQLICEQIFHVQGIFEHEIRAPITIDREVAGRACKAVATQKIGELQNSYNRLVTGPRKRARKYDTYEFVLSCFALEPIKFALHRHEIGERLDKLTKENKIPPASVNSMLNALQKFQTRREIELLEWRQAEQTLYMLEPAFLFFLRWAIDKKYERTPSVDIIRVLFDEAFHKSISERLRITMTPSLLDAVRSSKRNPDPK